MAAGGEVEAHEGVAGLQQRQEYRLVHLAAGVRLHIGEGRAEQLFRPFDRQRLGDVNPFAAAVVAGARISLAYLLVITEPCASSTARLTMFSEAISSTSWRCRPSSPWMAAAISGSACVKCAVKKESAAEPALLIEVLALEVIGEISPLPQPLSGLRPVLVGTAEAGPPD